MEKQSNLKEVSDKVFLNTQTWQLPSWFRNRWRTKIPVSEFKHVGSEGFALIAEEAREC